MAVEGNNIHTPFQSAHTPFLFSGFSQGEFDRFKLECEMLFSIVKHISSGSFYLPYPLASILTFYNPKNVTGV